MLTRGRQLPSQGHRPRLRLEGDASFGACEQLPPRQHEVALLLLLLPPPPLLLLQLVLWRRRLLLLLLRRLLLLLLLHVRGCFGSKAVIQPT